MVEGDVRPVVRRREQAVLARLGLAAPRPVSVGELVADLWGERPPPTAVDALRVHVSNLRKLLAAGAAGRSVLQTGQGTYRLDVPAEAVDTGRLASAVEGAEVAVLRRLLVPWPDHALGSLESGSGFFDGAARRIEDLLAVGAEVVAGADVAEGRDEPAVALLEEAIARSPYRERLWELLVRALLASGRRAEALRAFQRGRKALAEVGIDPGRGLAAAEAAVFADAAPPAERELVARYVDVDGSRIAYGTIGSAPLDLLFLHGGFVPFDTMRDTPRLAAFLDELADRFRVILVDRRGIGMSDGPSDGAPVTLDDWVADGAAVLDAVGSRRAVVLGHEHGGPVAIRLAAALPDRVVGLVLHSTAARPLRAPDHPFGPGEDALERLDRMIDQLPGSEDILRLVAPSAGEDRQLRAWLDRAGRLGASPARARELHRVFRYADVRSALPEVKAPAVVLHPARMIRTDPGQARFLAERLGDSELVMLDSGDHLFWLADADTVLAAIDRLVERIGGASASGEPPAALPVRLRALVAAASAVARRVLESHGPDACVEADSAVVAAYGTLAAARDAAAAVRAAHPDVPVAVDVGDTSGAAGDAEVRRIARSATAARGADG